MHGGDPAFNPGCRNHHHFYFATPQARSG